MDRVVLVGHDLQAFHEISIITLDNNGIEVVA